jgi:hypothetical protein
MSGRLCGLVDCLVFNGHEAGFPGKVDAHPVCPDGSPAGWCHRPASAADRAGESNWTSGQDSDLAEVLGGAASSRSPKAQAEGLKPYSSQVQQRHRPQAAPRNFHQPLTCANDHQRPRRQELASRGSAADELTPPLDTNGSGSGHAPPYGRERTAQVSDIAGQCLISTRSRRLPLAQAWMGYRP